MQERLFVTTLGLMPSDMMEVYLDLKHNAYYPRVRRLLIYNSHQRQGLGYIGLSDGDPRNGVKIVSGSDKLQLLQMCHVV